MPDQVVYVQPEYEKLYREYRALFLEISDSMVCLLERWVKCHEKSFLNKEYDKLIKWFDLDRNLERSRRLLLEVDGDVDIGPLEELSTRYRIATKKLESLKTMIEENHKMIDKLVLSFYLTRDLGDRWNRSLLEIEGAYEVAEKIEAKNLPEEERLEKTNKKLLFYANIYSERANFEIANALLETAKAYSDKRLDC